MTSSSYDESIVASVKVDQIGTGHQFSAVSMVSTGRPQPLTCNTDWYESDRVSMSMISKEGLIQRAFPKGESH